MIHVTGLSVQTSAAEIRMAQWKRGVPNSQVSIFLLQESKFRGKNFLLGG